MTNFAEIDRLLEADIKRLAEEAQEILKEIIQICFNQQIKNIIIDIIVDTDAELTCDYSNMPADCDIKFYHMVNEFAEKYIMGAEIDLDWTKGQGGYGSITIDLNTIPFQFIVDIKQYHQTESQLVLTKEVLKL